MEKEEGGKRTSFFSPTPDERRRQKIRKIEPFTVFEDPGLKPSGHVLQPGSFTLKPPTTLRPIVSEERRRRQQQQQQQLKLLPSMTDEERKLRELKMAREENLMTTLEKKGLSDERKKRRETTMLNDAIEVLTEDISSGDFPEFNWLWAIDNEDDFTENVITLAKERIETEQMLPTTVSVKDDTSIILTSTDCPVIEGQDWTGLDNNERYVFEDINVITANRPNNVIISAYLSGQQLINVEDKKRFVKGRQLVTINKPFKIAVKIDETPRSDPQTSQVDSNTEFNITRYTYEQIVEEAVSLNTIKPIKVIRCGDHYIPPMKLGTSEYLAYEEFKEVLSEGSTLDFNIYEFIASKSMHEKYFGGDMFNRILPNISNPNYEYPSMIIQLLVLLESMQRLGILHLDWKMDNIMLPSYNERALDLKYTTDKIQRMYGLSTITSERDIDKRAFVLGEQWSKKRRDERVGTNHYVGKPIVPILYHVTPSLVSSSPTARKYSTEATFLGDSTNYVNNSPIYSVIELESDHVPIVIDYGLSEVVDLEFMYGVKKPGDLNEPRGDDWFVARNNNLYTLSNRPPEFWFFLRFDERLPSYAEFSRGVVVGPKTEVFALGLVFLDLLNWQEIIRLKYKRSADTKTPLYFVLKDKDSNIVLGQNKGLVMDIANEYKKNTVYQSFEWEYKFYVRRKAKHRGYPVHFLTEDIENINSTTNSEGIDFHARYLWGLLLLLGLPSMPTEGQQTIRKSELYINVVQKYEAKIRKMPHYNYLRNTFQNRPDEKLLLLSMLQWEPWRRDYPYDILIKSEYLRKYNLITRNNPPPLSKKFNMEFLLNQSLSQHKEELQRRRRGGASKTGSSIMATVSNVDRRRDDFGDALRILNNEFNIEKRMISQFNNYHDTDLVNAQHYKKATYTITHHIEKNDNNEKRNISIKSLRAEAMKIESIKAAVMNVEKHQRSITKDYKIRYISNKVPHPWGASWLRDEPGSRKRAGKQFISLDEYVDICLQNKHDKNCSSCHSKGKAELQCSTCGLAIYCNKKCQSDHWNKGHVYACVHTQIV